MEFAWAYFPLALQAIYAVSALVPLRRLYVTKRSDQHAVSNHVLTLGAHAAMATWAWTYAHELGLVLSTCAGIALTLLTLTTVLHYRANPGGRPPRPASARRAGWVAPAERARVSFGVARGPVV
jgi:apolipoprotein N-acyltransferase